MNSTKFIDICFPDNDLPEIILAGRFNIGDRNHSPVYCQPDFALHLYFYNATMRLDGTEINLSPGDMTITPANSRSTYCLPDPPGMHYCAHFSTPKGNQNMMQLPCYIPASRQNRGAATYFEDIIELLQIDTTVAHRAANETLKLLLLQLALGIGVHREVSSKLERKLDSVSQIIEKDLDGELTTKKLARTVNLSPNYLAKAFHSKYGTTIKGYQLQRRIERAAFLLDFSNLSIKETGAMVGMPDSQYFNKRFRAVKGMSPTDYRNRAR